LLGPACPTRRLQQHDGDRVRLIAAKQLVHNRGDVLGTVISIPETSQRRAITIFGRDGRPTGRWNRKAWVEV
jgi:hypothetical protein